MAVPDGLMDGTVPQVLEYANQHPEDARELLTQEQAGKNRATLVAGLTTIADRHDAGNDQPADQQDSTDVPDSGVERDVPDSNVDRGDNPDFDPEDQASDDGVLASVKELRENKPEPVPFNEPMVPSDPMVDRRIPTVQLEPAPQLAEEFLVPRAKEGFEWPEEVVTGAYEPAPEQEPYRSPESQEKTEEQKAVEERFDKVIAGEEDNTVLASERAEDVSNVNVDVSDSGNAITSDADRQPESVKDDQAAADQPVTEPGPQEAATDGDVGRHVDTLSDHVDTVNEDVNTLRDDTRTEEQPNA